MPAAAQRAIAAYPWPEGAPVRVRIGMHTGQAVPAFGGYIGLDVHRAARIMAAGYGGEILLSQATQSSLKGALPEDITLRDLGEHRLKDLTRAERIFQVVTPDLPSDFPPLRTLDVASNTLPIQLTSFIGREREIPEVRRLLTTTRLLTLQGAGGAGKTRLAIQIAANLIEEFDHGVWLVDLAPLRDPALVGKVKSAIIHRQVDARTALHETLDEYTLLFEKIEDEYLKERMADIRDVVQRIMAHLALHETPAHIATDTPIILVEPEILPSQAMVLEKLKVVGIVTETGGGTGHAAILARALGIPSVSGLRGILKQVVTGDTLAAPDKPIYLDNVGHPVASKIALAKAKKSRIHAFGIDWDDSSGTRNGHFAPFAWSG